MAINDLKPGDVLLWWSDTMSIQIGKKLWSIPIPMPCAVHADIYVGNGKCRTSIQNVGSSTADVSKRMKQFFKWVAVRITSVDYNVLEVLKWANKIKCAYDWEGYYGQYLDIFMSPETFPIPDFSSKSDSWTEKLASRSDDSLYCSSFVAAVIELGSNIKIVSNKDYFVTSPQDIYDCALKNKALRKIVEF